MWDSNYILGPACQKTGMTAEEIRKTPWSEIEKRLGVHTVYLGKGKSVDLDKLAQERKEIEEFLYSFSRKN
jgi:hypothetical protein